MTRLRLKFCREGYYYLIVFAFVVVGALLRDINLMVIVAGMMVGLLCYNLWSVIATLRGVRIQRTIPLGAYAGAPFTVGVALQNVHTRRSVWAVVVRDQIQGAKGPPLGSQEKIDVFFEYVPGGETKRTSYQGQSLHRGQFRCGPLEVETCFPLGLVQRTLGLDQFSQFTVFPRLGRLTPHWNRLQQETFVGNQHVRRKQGIMEADFVSLRNWRQGDSRRWIHWRTSARRGELVVRQFEQQRNEDLVLVLDLWQPATPEAGDLERVEKVVSFAATAAADACRRGGSRMTISIAAEQPQMLQGIASLVYLNEILEELAVAQGSSQTRIGEAVVQSIAEARPDSSLVLVGTRPLTWSDSQFTTLPENWIRQLASRRILMLDASSPHFEDYFKMEQSS